jgi:CRISPR-associated endonuclease/helicase Cas3
MRRFAHSLTDNPDERHWEPLETHLRAVGARARGFAAAFGMAEWGEAAGLLHDIGKAADAYQFYIRGKAKSPDHSTAGAVEAERRFGPIGRCLAFVIAGHHAGLADGTQLSQRLAKVLENYAGWEDYTGEIPKPASFPSKKSPYPNFTPAFFIRMVFSCLVDADFLETEVFYTQAAGKTVERGGFSDIASLRARLAAFMAGKASAAPTTLNILRNKILAHAISRAELAPGLFTMTVPTGGGKTLASLSFALEHAARHGMERVIYVAPYTSIIEQTAQVFTAALGEGDVLEHHSGFDWDKAEDKGDETDADGLKKLRHASENWDAPVVVTTAVQFFESLFAARPGACRKLHNIARSVVVLDEAQTLPLQVLRPCLAALEELTLNYGASVVLCTATQPAWRRMDDALPPNAARQPQGFEAGPERELAPGPAALFAALKRVQMEVMPAPVEDVAIAARFAEQPQMLCIVNTRAHAKELFGLIAQLPGARHLTTLMCAAHRRQVLAEIRDDLAQGCPARLVATSLIEAGVDVDFAEVWRAETGLDSVAQAAGRCNREGKRQSGRVVVFVPAERKLPKNLIAFRDAARLPLQMPEPLGLEAVQNYFKELYFNRGYEALDALEIDRRRGVLPVLKDARLDIPFAAIAEAFHLIDDKMRSVIVDWQGRAKAAIDALHNAPVPPLGTLRKLQQFAVPVPDAMWRTLRASGGIQPVKPEAYGERFMVVMSAGLYDEVRGLKTEDAAGRTAEENVM